MICKLRQSKAQFSPVDFLLNEAVVLIESDNISTVSTDGVDDVHDLLVIITVAELLVQVLHVIKSKLILSSDIKESEVLMSSFFIERRSLNKLDLTSLLVSSLTNPSKSRGWPPVESLMSMISLKTISYFLSSPRV